MKVRIKVRPSGYISLDGGPPVEWPEVGSVVELPDPAADDLINSGRAEKVRIAKAEPRAEPVETRPAAADDVEVRRPGRPRKAD